MAQLTNSRSTRSMSAARVCTILGFVFAAVAVLLLPPLFGVAAVALGVIGGALGDRPLGWFAAAAGALGMVIGMVIGAMVFTS